MAKTETQERPSYHSLMVKVDQAKLATHKRERVSDRYWQAWWYASGIDDTEGTNHADAFAYEHGMDAFLHESGQTHFLESIQGAYKDFRDEGGN